MVPVTMYELPYCTVVDGEVPLVMGMAPVAVMVGATAATVGSSATALMVVKVFGWATAGSAISTVTGPLAVVVKVPVELVAEPTGSTWNV